MKTAIAVGFALLAAGCATADYPYYGGYGGYGAYGQYGYHGYEAYPGATYYGPSVGIGGTIYLNRDDRYDGHRWWERGDREGWRNRSGDDRDDNWRDRDRSERSGRSERRFIENEPGNEAGMGYRNERSSGNEAGMGRRGGR